MADMKTPDAVFIPRELIRGSHSITQAHSMFEIADKILEVKIEEGEKSYGRHVGSDGRMMWTKGPEDTYNFPSGHYLEKQPRYFWKDVEGGFKYGWLVPAAKPEPKSEVASA